MHEGQKQMKQLETGWRVILVIWGAIFASLGMYLKAYQFVPSIKKIYMLWLQLISDIEYLPNKTGL